MKKALERINYAREVIRHFFGFSRMSKNFIVFSNIHLEFLMFYTLQLVFMNTLLRKFSDTNGIIYIYNLIFFGCIPLGMTLASFSIKKKTFIFTMRSSLYLWIAVLMTTITLITTKQISIFWPLVAFFASIANGVYWMSYYIALTDCSDVNNRDIGLSIIGIYTAIANIVIPLIGGYVIESFENYSGYIIMFICALFSAVSAIIRTKKLTASSKSSPESEEDSKIHLLVAIKAIFNDKIWLQSSLSEFFRGTRDGVFIFLLNILIFSVSENEALVGINAFISGVINIIANWVLGKLLSKNNNSKKKTKLLSIAVIALFASSFLPLLNLSVPTLITMTCINAFFTIFLQNINQSIFCLCVQVNKEAYRLRVESFVLKTYFLAFGRIIGIVLMMFLPETNIFISAGIIFLSLLQIGTVITAQKTISLVDEELNK